MSLTLYYHPLSSYCHKVLVALYEHGIEFERRLINLGDPAERAELQALSPLGKFPVIRDHGHDRNLPESTVIIEYLDRHVAAAPALLPNDVDAALDARVWDRFFDNQVHGPVQRIVADRIRGGEGDVPHERAALATAYAIIDARMAGRTWVASAGFGLADCAAAPALFYASTLLPFPDAAVHLQAYFERLLARPSFQRVLGEARPFFHMYPFAEALPRRFR